MSATSGGERREREGGPPPPAEAEEEEEEKEEEEVAVAVVDGAESAGASVEPASSAAYAWTSGSKSSMHSATFSASCTILSAPWSSTPCTS